MARVRGYPTSGNRASSFHLHWEAAPALSEVSVVLQVVAPPLVPELYFWALQVSFASAEGVTGGGHLGLQWHPQYPGGTAVNWGGYDRSGAILPGTESPLPSALGNANTRNFQWQPGAAYRLRIRSDRPTWWAGEVVDLASKRTTIVRSLKGDGHHLISPVVWSEVFARCDAPPVAVVWSKPEGLTVEGGRWGPRYFTANYQEERQGGCSNTDSRLLPHGVGQFTSISRTNPTGIQLPTGNGQDPSFPSR